MIAYLYPIILLVAEDYSSSFYRNRTLYLPWIKFFTAKYVYFLQTFGFLVLRVFSSCQNCVFLHKFHPLILCTLHFSLSLKLCSFFFFVFSFLFYFFSTLFCLHLLNRLLWYFFHLLRHPQLTDRDRVYRSPCDTLSQIVLMTLWTLHNTTLKTSRFLSVVVGGKFGSKTSIESQARDRKSVV